MAFDLSSTIDSAAQEWNVDPALLHSVSQVESGQNANGPDSSAGAMGAFQVMPGTASDMGVTNLRDPTQNVYAGAKYLSGLLDKYQTPELALAAYNSGPGRVDDYLAGRASLPAETLAYVPKVVTAYQQRTAANGSAAPTDGTPAPYQVATADTGSASDANPNPNAPPPSAGAPASADGAPPAAPPSDDDLHALLTSAPPASAAPPPSASAGAQGTAPATDPSTSDDTLRSMLVSGASGSVPAAGTASAAGAATASAAAPGAPATAATGGGVMGAVGRGLSTIGAGINTATEGVANTGMRAAAYVDSKVPALAGLDQSAGLDPQAGTQELDQSIRQSDQAHAGSPLYTLGKIGTDLAFTLPVAGLAGNALAAGADALGVPTATNLLAGAPSVVRLAGTTAVNAVKGSAQGLGATAITAGSSDEPIRNQLATGAIAGGVLGAAVPAVMKVVGGAASNLLGGTISPETAALAQTARDTYGIPLQAGQISDSPFVRFLGDTLNKLPFSGAGAAADTQRVAMNQAIAGSFGETADRITPDVMQAARTRLGQTFDTLSNQIPVQADNGLLSDLGDIESSAQDALTPDRASIISRQVDNVLGKAADGNGTITGDAYQALTAKGGVIDNAMNNNDPGVQNFAGQIRNALDAAMQRSAPPQLAQQLSDARLQYKNLMTIAPLAAKAQGTDGNVSPLQLLQAVRSNFSDMAFRGGGTLGDLANIGQRFMRPPPDSGTATRTAILAKLGALTPTGLAAAGQAPVSATGAALGTVGAITAGRAVSSFLRSPYAVNRLIRNGLAGNSSNPLVSGLVGNAGTIGGIVRPADQAQVNLLAPGPR